jgi:hypothetical protein
VAWTFIGGPFEGLYRNPSVIHDVACVQRRHPWYAVHRAFYSAMLAAGVDLVKAKIMYAAVYHLGPRWDDAIAGPAPPPRLEEADFPSLAAMIEQREREGRSPGVSGFMTRRPMTLEEIENVGSWR